MSRDKNGFIYIINQPGIGHYKIGFTKSPKLRLAELQIANPLLQILSIHVGTTLDERHLHNKYRKCRIAREWFRLSQYEIDEINQFFMDKYMGNPAAYLSILCRSIAEMANSGLSVGLSKQARLLKAQRRTIPPERVAAIESAKHIKLTDFEKSEIARYGFSQESTRAVKAFWEKDKYISSYEAGRLSGFSESFCQKTLSIIRKENANGY